ncbi:MAG: T9SS type A sorting domain-containing protein [Lacibacter sp.]|jgi:hypothetical protein
MKVLLIFITIGVQKATKSCQFFGLLILLALALVKTNDAVAQYEQQGSKIVNPETPSTSQFGYDVSLSADGNTAVVACLGGAYVFTRSGTQWTQEASKLIGTPFIFSSAAISGDGNTVIVGGYGDNNNIGAAWIYVRTATGWQQQGNKLVGTSNVGTSLQGISVAISFDGNTVAVGGETDNNNIGAVWIFVRNGTNWIQQGPKLVGSGSIGSIIYQGRSVSLSGDGNTLAFGGFADNSNVGAIWVFARTNGIWSQQGSKLVGSGSIGESRQGSSVAISEDGNTIVGGGFADNGVGGAWIFIKSASNWIQQGPKLLAADAVGVATQGRSVSIAADGNTVLIGGELDNNGIGAAWVFKRSSGVWNQFGNKLVGSGSVNFSGQGRSVEISADASTLLVGGWSDNVNIGAAWVYLHEFAPLIQSYTPSVATTGSSVVINGANFNQNVQTVSFGGVPAESFTILNATTISAVVGTGATGNVRVKTNIGTATYSGFIFSATTNTQNLERDEFINIPSFINGNTLVVNYKLNGLSNMLTAALYNLNGQLVVMKDRIKSGEIINLPKLVPGIYLLKLNSSLTKRSYLYKILIQ